MCKWLKRVNKSENQPKGAPVNPGTAFGNVAGVEDQTQGMQQTWKCIAGGCEVMRK